MCWGYVSNVRVNQDAPVVIRLPGIFVRGIPTVSPKDLQYQCSTIFNQEQRKTLSDII